MLKTEFLYLTCLRTKEARLYFLLLVTRYGEFLQISCNSTSRGRWGTLLYMESNTTLLVEEVKRRWLNQWQPLIFSG